MNYPDNWQYLSIKECCSVVSGSTPKRNRPEYWDGEIDWVTPKDLSNLNIPVLKEAPEKITELGYKSCSTTLLPEGSILFSSRAPIGLIAIAGKEMCTNQGFKSLVPNASIDSAYLYWCIRNFTPQLSAQGSGTTFKELSKTIVEKFKIPLPPLEEQKRIAAILDKADGIRRKRKEAIALTEELLRSTFLDMFGDIKGNAWEMCKIENIIAKHQGSIRTGPFGSQLLHSEFVDQGIAVLGIDNAVQNEFQWAKSRFITQEKYAALKRYTVRPDDVIITIMGTCGRCAIVPRDCPTAINTKHLCCITLGQKKCLSEFLHSYFLIHPEARKYLKMNAKGAIMEGLNMTIIKNLPVPLVPISLQQHYREIHQKQYKLKDKIFSGQSDDENLFNSLLQKAFRGEL